MAGCGRACRHVALIWTSGRRANSGCVRRGRAGTPRKLNSQATHTLLFPSCYTGLYNRDILTEQELIHGCLREDEACRRLLFERYAGLLMTICLRYSGDRHEAEDMLQESFIRVFQYLGQFKGKGSFEGWLRRITVNSALSALREKKLRFVEVPDERPGGPAIDPQALSKLNEQDLLRMISDLPPGYRVIFNLYVMEGFNHEEIGRLFGISPGTSRSQLFKAKKVLQEKIAELEKLPS